MVRRFKQLGLAFDKEDAKGVPNYIKSIGTNFPVGSAETQAVNGFLGISVMDYQRMRVPRGGGGRQEGRDSRPDGSERQRTGQRGSQPPDPAEYPRKRIGKITRMKLVFGLFLALGLTLQAAAPVPRPAPEFGVHEPSGKESLISAQKGKVVVIQFLFTWCPHCQSAAQWLTRMQTELGPKGLQVYGVAFNDEVQTKNPAENNKVTAAFSQYASFPVGPSPKEAGAPLPGALSVPRRVRRAAAGRD